MVPSGPLPVLTCLHVCLSLILSKTDSHPHICCSWPQAAFSRRPWEKVCQSAHPIPGLLCLEELHKMVAPETEISTGHQLGAVLGISFEEGRRQRQIWAGVSGCHAGLNDSLAQPAGLEPGCSSELTQVGRKGQAFIPPCQSVIKCGPPRKGVWLRARWLCQQGQPPGSLP